MARPRRQGAGIQDPRKRPLGHSELLQRLEDSRKVRRWFERDWSLNVSYLANEPYVGFSIENGRLVERTATDDAVRVKNNVLAKANRVERAKILRQTPKAVSLPARDSMDDLQMARMINAWFDQMSWEWRLDSAMRTATWWATATGNCFQKMYWDTGRNAPWMDVCSPYEVFPDPFARRFEDARWVIHSRFYDEETAWDLYADYPKSKVEHLRVSGTQEVNALEHRLVSAIGVNIGAQYRPNLEGVLVHEYWQPPTKANPDGRFTVFTPSGIVIEQEFPYEHGQLPFAHYGSVERGSTMWYASSLDFGARDLQDELNRSESQIIENRNVSNGKWYIPAGLELEEMPDGRPRQILKALDGANPGLKPELLAVDSLPAWVGAEPARIKDNIRDSLGQNEVSNGSVPGRVESGQAIQLLQESDDSVVKDAIHSRDEALSRVFWQSVALLKQFGDPQILVRTWDDDGVIDVQTFKTDQINLDFQVRVQSTDALPNSVAGKFDRVLNLVQYKVITEAEARQLLDLTKADPSLDLTVAARSRAWRDLQYLKTGKVVEAREWANHDVNIQTIEQYMNTLEFDTLGEDIQNKMEYYRDQNYQMRLQRIQEEAMVAAAAQGAAPAPGGAPAEGAPPEGGNPAPAEPQPVPPDAQGPAPVTG